MARSLPELEQHRENLVGRIAHLGDLRPGTVSSTSGRCGKANCHCHQPGGPPHGPNFRLTFKRRGKTISQSLPTPAAIAKAEREVTEFRKFQELSQEFVTTNAEICRLRPLPENASTPQEKKRQKRSGKRSRARSINS